MSKGIRKLIYLPCPGIWDSMKCCAEKENRSISNYLVNLHQANIKPDPVAKVAADLAEIVSRPKKGSPVKQKKGKLPVGCVECRAPFGHRVGCPLGGA